MPEGNTPPANNPGQSGNPAAPAPNTMHAGQGNNYTIVEGEHASTSTELNESARNSFKLDRGGTEPGANKSISQRQQESLARQNQQLTAEAQSTRPAPSLPASNYMAVQHPELKQRINQNVDPSSVRESGDNWITTGNALVDFQTDVKSAITQSETGWRGSAGNQARQYFAEIGTWVGKTGTAANLAGTQMQSQADALQTAKTNMPEPIHYDVNEANTRIRNAPPAEAWNVYYKELDTYNKHVEAHQRAATTMTQYDSALGGTKMPAFTQPPALFSGGGGKESTGRTASTTSSGTGAPTVNRGGPGGSSSGTPGTGSGGGSGTNPPPNVGGNQPGPVVGSGGTGTTDPSLHNPSGPPNVNTGPNIGGGNQNQNLAGAPPMMGPMGPGGMGGDDSERGRGGRGFGPGGSGNRGFGPGGSPAGPGSGAGARPGGMPGAGMAGPGGVAGGRGGGAGRGGMGGMPMGGAGAQGDEDQEHQRPTYLVEADPDALFGTDEKTAPPVIGG
ncbi:PPE family protein [Herbihabitans rhizosphaerae]|uniref:PPE family protein n=1 Tax=Herbihabitans rhizosphaerae TaxID=1872711 RepID=A0A4Q7L5K8_9PSEU|nr:PPE domain-containing protein [Herbihabitans rhizosphaerae]RZS44918.1 PPE family protein [Herbihabitans rhizosphaerae]